MRPPTIGTREKQLFQPAPLLLSPAPIVLLVLVSKPGHTLWTSAAPALTYGLYAQEWHLTHTVIAGIFAIYPITVVVMLLCFGGISDQIGRRATMLAGLLASLVGALLFAVAPSNLSQRLFWRFADLFSRIKRLFCRITGKWLETGVTSGD